MGPRGFEPRTTGAQAPHPTRLDDGPTSFPRNNLISGGGYVLCFLDVLKLTVIGTWLTCISYTIRNKTNYYFIVKMGV